MPTLREVLMSCYHNVYFTVPPDIDDEIYCTQCETGRTVIVVFGYWRAVCRQCSRHCYGPRERDVTDQAMRHVTGTGHAMTVGRDGEKSWTLIRPKTPNEVATVPTLQYHGA